MQTEKKGNRIAVLIPCYNEALTIGNVVRDYRQALPDADIYVYDNNSTDETGRLLVTLRPVRPVPSCAPSPVRARATWCGPCSVTSRRTAI